MSSRSLADLSPANGASQSRQPRHPLTLRFADHGIAIEIEVHRSQIRAGLRVSHDQRNDVKVAVTWLRLRKSSESVQTVADTMAGDAMAALLGLAILGFRDLEAWLNQ